jgi:NTE family protein
MTTLTQTKNLAQGFIEAKDLKKEEVLSAGLDTEDLKNKTTKFNEKITKTKELKLSDITDKDGNQYIDLVMEGGVMLGLALVGYTYALESMGIRFYSIAGTSAGAINAALLTAWNKKPDKDGHICTFASEWVLEEIAKKINDGAGFFDFVDIGNKELENFIKKKVKEKIEKSQGKTAEEKRNIAKQDNEKKIDKIKTLARACDQEGFVDGFRDLWERGIKAAAAPFAKPDMKDYARIILRLTEDKGLCKGEAFKTWITKLLDGQGAKSSDDLKKNREKLLIEAQLKRDDEVYEAKFTENNFKIFATDITTATKAVFPKDNKVYGINNPEDYIRASMSVPFFFKPVKLTSLSTEKNDWEDIGYYGELPKKVTFVDGGLITNFPIDAFHADLSDKKKCEEENSSPFNISKPTFGAKLGIDFITKITEQDNSKKSPAASFDTDDLLSLSKAMFETMRFTHERDFIDKNPDYKQLIKCIDVDENQAFNFAMDSATQQYLFWSGYKAAIEFIENKESKTNWWEKYKEQRESMKMAVCKI